MFKIPSFVRSITTLLAFACLFASAAYAQGVVVHSNIAYKSAGNLSEYERERNVLDLYLPESGSDFPVIVWFHGGGLTAGDKAEEPHTAIARSLVARGIAVASVNYRFSPRVSFPAYVEDAAAAIAWTINNIGDYRGDVAKVFVSGHSAGGYLAAMASLDEHYLGAYGISLGDIRGVIPISGQMVTHATVRTERNLPAARPIMDVAAPAYHVREDAPPFLAIAGGNDLPARPEENRYFIAAMKAAGHQDATYLEVAGRNHGSIIGLIPEEDDPVATAMVNFITRLLAASE